MNEHNITNESLVFAVMLVGAIIISRQENRRWKKRFSGASGARLFSSLLSVIS